MHCWQKLWLMQRRQSFIIEEQDSHWFEELTNAPETHRLQLSKSVGALILQIMQSGILLEQG